MHTHLSEAQDAKFKRTTRKTAEHASREHGSEQLELVLFGEEAEFEEPEKPTEKMVPPVVMSSGPQTGQRDSQSTGTKAQRSQIEDVHAVDGTVCSAAENGFRIQEGVPSG